MSEIRSQATPVREELLENLRDVELPNTYYHQDDGQGTPAIRPSTPDEAAEMALDVVEAAGWSKPRTVNSAAEAEALAEGSVILDARGEVLHWIDRGDYLQWSDIWGNECGADYPATVLFTPGDAG